MSDKSDMPFAHVFHVFTRGPRRAIFFAVFMFSYEANGVQKSDPAVPISPNAQ